jgi:hypothetical protein
MTDTVETLLKDPPVSDHAANGLPDLSQTISLLGNFIASFASTTAQHSGLATSLADSHTPLLIAAPHV